MKTTGEKRFTLINYALSFLLEPTFHSGSPNTLILSLHTRKRFPAPIIHDIVLCVILWIRRVGRQQALGAMHRVLEPPAIIVDGRLPAPGAHLPQPDISAVLVVEIRSRVQPVMVSQSHHGFRHGECHGQVFEPGEALDRERLLHQLCVVASLVHPGRHHHIEAATLGSGFRGCAAAGEPGRCFS